MSLLERHVLRVAQLGVRLRVALAVPADLGGLVPLAQGAEHGLQLGGGELHAQLARRSPAGSSRKAVAVLVQRFAVQLGKPQQGTDLLLARLSGLDFPRRTASFFFLLSAIF